MPLSFSGKGLCAISNTDIQFAHDQVFPVRLGQFSIRINDQWRICFRFVAGDVRDVEIADYH